jgi:hypothetical protein
MFCSCCQEAPYCSAACQKKEWLEHRGFCQIVGFVTKKNGDYGASGNGYPREPSLTQLLQEASSVNLIGASVL